MELFQGIIKYIMSIVNGVEVPMQKKITITQLVNQARGESPPTIGTNSWTGLYRQSVLLEFDGAVVR